jgi:hypothetical protein
MDGMINCLRQAHGFIVVEKHHASNFSTVYQIFGTVTNPATGTESMGLAADAHGVMVFAISS